MYASRVARIARPIARLSAPRKYSTALPLTDALPSVPAQSEAAQARPVLRESKLSNGVRVVTVDSQVPVTAVGVFADAGSRYETIANAGSFFALKSLAFTSTLNRTSLRLVREFEVLGASYSAASGREQVAYSSEVQSDKVGDVFPVLVDVLRPRLAEWEIRDQWSEVVAESRRVQSNARSFVFEQVHAEAFRNKGLGQPNYIPESNIDQPESDDLRRLVNQFYVPERLVVAASGGVQHEQFAEMVAKAFDALPAGSGLPVAKSASVYLGGEFRQAANFETQLAIAFNGVSWTDKDLFAVKVLKTLLGGARRSLTSIGAGSGFASRLGSKVSGPIQELSTFASVYSDGGVFGVFGRADIGNAGKLSDTIIAELRTLASKSVTDADLKRAVAQAKAAVLFGTETRSALVEFVATQCLAGRPISSAEQFAAEIDKVNADDVARVAKRLLSSRPTVVAVGDVVGVPSADSIAKSLSS